MTIILLLVIGLCAGSFVNALVWRIREQDKQDTDKTRQKHLSLIRGRSMCPHCGHQLSAKDLIPVLSWLALRGKCRYCGKPIPVQYPLVELATAGLFVASYLWWPAAFTTPQIAIFALWLVLLTGLMALFVYDLRWFLLPNRIIYPLLGVAVLQAMIVIGTAPNPATAALNVILAVIVGGGLFYLLFQISGGKWIGGGDVKLGALLGLIAATPARSFLFIFLASLLGSLVSLPLLMNRRMKRDSLIPFGPFLIAGLVIVQLFGADILSWYRGAFINY